MPISGMAGAPIEADLDLESAENLAPLSFITNEVGSQTPRVRANFPETWIYQMIDAG